MTNHSPTQPKPWATADKNSKTKKQEKDMAARIHRFYEKATTASHTLGFYKNGGISILAGGAAGALITMISQGMFPTPAAKVFLILVVIALFLTSFSYLLRQVGVSVSKIMPMYANEPTMRLGLRASRGEMKAEENKHRSVPAPELALLQFVQQVRAYATEKSFARNKGDVAKTSTAAKTDQADLMKRRWDEVVDSLGEFEIYLANDPQGVIEKIASKFPVQVIDVSQVFRDVAEGFDNTWRRKGINIETAIVTPLKARTNEALLRRLLVGPWRASAYFARRGHGVVFSAKSEQGLVKARWECDGLHIQQSYLDFALKTDVHANERIERGMIELSTDAMSPNTLNALISLITWIDLAKASGLDFAFKHTNDGFVIELTLEGR